MRGNRMKKTGHSLGRLALLLALLLALCGFSGALAEADAAQAAERTALVDAANGNFEADMLDMLSQYSRYMEGAVRRSEYFDDAP